MRRLFAGGAEVVHAGDDALAEQVVPNTIDDDCAR